LPVSPLVLDVVSEAREHERESVVSVASIAQWPDAEPQLSSLCFDLERHLSVERRLERAEQRELKVVHALVRQLEPCADSAENERADRSVAIVARDGEDDAVHYRTVRLGARNDPHLHSAFMSTPGDFDVRIEQTSEGAVVVHVSGELDLATVSVLEEALTHHPVDKRIVIDLGACSFLDSSGVRLLATTARRSDESGGRLDLVVADDSGVARVLEITGIDTLVGVHSSLDAAL